jgi:hypothetical protein
VAAESGQAADADVVAVSSSPFGTAASGAMREVRADAPRGRAGALSLPPFSGVGDSLAVHLARWRNCAEFFSWDAVARVCFLKGSLTGVAANLLWQLPENCSEQELLQLLHARFGDEGQVETYRSQLRARKRRKGESLQSLYLDIHRLVSLSFPAETGRYVGVCARDAFLSALGDNEARFRALDKGAENLEQAYEIVSRYESLMGGWDSSEDSDRRRVRQVEKAPVEGWQAEFRQQMQRFESSLKSEMQRMETSWEQRFKSVERACVASADGADNAVGPPPQQQQGLRRGNARFGRAGRQDADGRPRYCYNCGSAGHLRRDCAIARGSASSSAVASSTQPGLSHQGDVHAVANGTETASKLETCLPIRIKRGDKYIDLLAIIDSGSRQCLLPSCYVRSRLRPCSTKLVAANGTQISTLGEWTTDVFVDGVCVRTTFVVSDQISEVLLSRDWLRDNNFVWDFGNEIRINGKVIRLKPRPTADGARRVVAAERTVLQPRSVTGMRVNAQLSSLQNQPSETCIDACAVCDGVFVPHTLLAKDPSGCVFAINPTDTAIIVQRGQQVATAHPVKVCDIRNVSEGSGSLKPPNDSESVSQDVDAVTSAKMVITDEDRQIVESMLVNLPAEFTAAEIDKIRALLFKFKDLFARHEYDMGNCNLGTCTLELKDPSLPPVCQKMRTHPVRHLDLIDAEVARLLKNGIIRESCSQWNSNVVLVPKRSPHPGLPTKYRLTV